MLRVILTPHSQVTNLPFRARRQVPHSLAAYRAPEPGGRSANARHQFRLKLGMRREGEFTSDFFATDCRFKHDPNGSLLLFRFGCRTLNQIGVFS
jgi:hypothetical protein